MRSLCPDPSLKFITPIHTQFSKPSNTWDQAVSCVTHPSALRRRDSTQGKASCISLILVARSSPSNIESLIANVGNLEKKLKEAYNSVPWNPFPVDFWFSHAPQLADRKLMTVLSNSSAISDYVGFVLERATMMYKKEHTYTGMKSMAALVKCLRKDLKLCTVFVVTMGALYEAEDNVMIL